MKYRVYFRQKRFGRVDIEAYSAANALSQVRRLAFEGKLPEEAIRSMDREKTVTLVTHTKELP